MRPTAPTLSLLLMIAGNAAIAGTVNTDLLAVPEQPHAGDDQAGASRNKRADDVQQLEGVSVTATLDIARNMLSPDTGS